MYASLGLDDLKTDFSEMALISLMHHKTESYIPSKSISHSIDLVPIEIFNINSVVISAVTFLEAHLSFDDIMSP